MRALAAALLALALSGCGALNWLVAHPAQGTAIATGAAIAASGTATAVNVRELVER